MKTKKKNIILVLWLYLVGLKIKQAKGEKKNYMKREPHRILTIESVVGIFQHRKP